MREKQESLPHIHTIPILSAQDYRTDYFVYLAYYIYKLFLPSILCSGNFFLVNMLLSSNLMVSFHVISLQFLSVFSKTILYRLVVIWRPAGKGRDNVYVFVLFTESKHYFLLARRSTWPRLSCALPLECSKISIALQCKSTSTTNTWRIEFFNETKKVHYNYKLIS